jgi:hypothetical protein
MQLVVVKFLDPATFNHWSTWDTVEESQPRLCVASGLLLGETKEVVKVGLLASGDKKTVSDWIAIPIGCVLTVDYVREIDWEDE